MNILKKLLTSSEKKSPVSLIDRPVKRVFTFGCSFTDYHWLTWPEIIAYELEVPLYNYGRSGAGNQYIANMISQADCIHKFNEDDLVMICWTNACREDRYKNERWVTPGNIFSQGIYDENYVKEWADPVGYILRDMATIKLITNFLQNKNCQFHMMSMCNLIEIIDQGQMHLLKNLTYKQKLKDMYKEELSYIHLDFFSVLWKNDLQKYKFPKDRTETSEYFNDGHPSPLEHLEYLQYVFSNSISQTTVDAVKERHAQWIFTLKRLGAHYKRNFSIYEIDDREEKNLKSSTTLVKTEYTDHL